MLSAGRASLRCLSVQLCGSVPSVWGTSSQLWKKMGDFTLQITLLYISCEIVSEGVSVSVSLNSGQLTARLQFPLFLTPYPLSYTKKSKVHLPSSSCRQQIRQHLNTRHPSIGKALQFNCRTRCDLAASEQLSGGCAPLLPQNTQRHSDVPRGQLDLRLVTARADSTALISM